MIDNKSAHSQPESGPEIASDLDRQKATWEKPEFQRIGAEDAETGINPGPETLILLS